MIYLFSHLRDIELMYTEVLSERKEASTFYSYASSDECGRLELTRRAPLVDAGADIGPT